MSVLRILGASLGLLTAITAEAQADPVADVENRLLSLFEHDCRAVAIGDAHGAANETWLRNALLLREDLTDYIDVIAVEFANSFYQDLIDRYVMEGEDVPYEERAKIWRDTAQLGAWDSPITEEFFDLARQGNLNRQPDRRVRVLALDTPIDWSVVHSPDDLDHFPPRGQILGERARDEGLAKGRTLIIVGAGHYVRDGGGRSSRIIDRAFPGKLCVLARIAGDGEEAKRFADQFGLDNAPALFFPIKGTKMGAVKTKSVLNYSNSSKALEKTSDGVLYFGSDSLEIRHPDPGIYDGPYGEELNRRARLLWPKGAPKFLCPRLESIGVDIEPCD